LRRKTRLAKDNFTTVEEEKKVGECDEGTLIGDIAMLYPERETRKLSGMAKTDCVFLILNKDAFDILIRVRRTSLV